ncbi:MAG: hypothetical protein ACLTYY_03310, partial [Faecalibacterium prausnitzii]
MDSIPAPLSISNIPMELTVRGLVVSMKDSFPAPGRYPPREKAGYGANDQFLCSIAMIYG